VDAVSGERPRVALLATGRSTFVEEAGRSMHRRALALLQELGAEVEGPQRLVEFAEEVRATGLTPAAEALPLLLCATFADASVALAAFGQSRRPVILWAVRDPAPLGERLYLNSLCGANLAAHALVREGVEVRLLYGDPEEEAVRRDLRLALAGRLRPPTAGSAQPLGDLAAEGGVHAALAGLRGRRIGAVGEAPVGFTSCEYDGEWLRSRLGLEVRPLALEAAFARIQGVSESRRRAVVEEATAESPSIAALAPTEVDLFGATTVALGDWAREEGLDALGLRCWPEFPLELGVCPCSALGRLAGQGIPTQCERDVNGGASMLLLKALGAEDTYLADVVAIDQARNAVTYWHCGLAPGRLAADPTNAHQDVHCNRGIGVVGNFPLRPGRVTVARIGWSSSYRLYLTGGEAVPGPNRFKGNSLDVVLDGEATDAVRTFVERGFEHHTALAWGELRPQLRQAARLLDLELVEC
jgi:L-fucose isomerase-like protein